MKLQQLRYVVEIVRQGNHLSAAAEALHTSQPGVSRQIQLLESELGVEIFLRTRNRIIGLTEAGEQVLAIAKRVTADLDALRSLKADLTNVNSGRFVIATTHTQARYILPKIIVGFIKRYPAVELELKQGDPESICQMVDDGLADCAVGPETRTSYPQLLKVPCAEIQRIVVGVKGHPVFREPELSCAALAKYPLIAYDPRYSGNWKVMEAFRRAGYEPRISFSSIDADISKMYATLGLGLAVLTDVAFDPEVDVDLEARDASSLFPPSRTMLTLRPTTYVRPFILEFLASLSESLTVSGLRDAIRRAARKR